ncbi:MAG TPA: response regulator [Polyangiaceae bacterium]|jgi:two-component system OmpR family response regulator
MATAGKPARVLVVDDDAILARVYGRALIAAGFEVDVAADGAEAFERILAESYDVILSDLCMPRLDGLDLLKEARRRRPNVPVVIMTARLDAEVYAAASELGSVRCLSKPMTIQELTKAVESAATIGAARVRSSDRKTTPR